MNTGFAYYQKGQAMVFVLIMFVIIGLGIAYVFNAGMLSNEKSRLQNTVDASAYSAAAVHAKDLNFKAYTNRTMVANQIAIAQMISMVSWVRFAEHFFDNVDLVKNFVPGFGDNFGTASDDLDGIIEDVTDGAAIAISLTDALNETISEAQVTMHEATVNIARETIVDVAEQQDPLVDTNLLAFIDVGLPKNRFTKRYAPQPSRTERMDEFREVTLNSRDGFTKRRTYTYLSEMDGNPTVELQRAGGAELIGNSEIGEPNYYTWVALDTLEMKTKETILGKDDEVLGIIETDTPIGHGGAQTGHETCFFACHGTDQWGDSWNINYDTSQSAAEDAILPVVGQFTGLKPFYDVIDSGLVANESEKMGMTLLFTKPYENIKTARKIPYGVEGSSTDLESKTSMIENKMYAVAKSTAYFARPTIRKGNREYGNLYNPYWQPKLTKIPVDDLLALQEMLIDDDRTQVGGGLTPNK